VREGRRKYYIYDDMFGRIKMHLTWDLELLLDYYKKKQFLGEGGFYMLYIFGRSLYFLDIPGLRFP
jgi:hypothetical protein